MNAADIITVSTTVVTLVQFAKWSGVPDERGPAVVLALSLVGVAFWAWSTGTFTRATAFQYLAGYIAVATSAAGVFGFTRKARTSITSTREPPTGGAGSNVTDDAGDSAQENGVQRGSWLTGANALKRLAVNLDLHARRRTPRPGRRGVPVGETP